MLQLKMDLKCLFVNIGLLVLLNTWTAYATRDEWCSGDHDHDHEDELPHPEDFLAELFKLYGDNITCTIQHDEYEHLLEDLGIGSGIHEPHVHQETYSVDHTCFDGHDLLAIHNVSEDVGLTEADFISMCPAFIQQVVQGCAEHTDTHLPPTAGEVWGYGILAVAVVSSCALFGLVIVKWKHSSGYKYLLTVMLGLAVGTLLSDSLMHLIPHSLGLHVHTDGAHSGGVDSFVWKTLLACLAALGFFNLQMILQYFNKGAKHSHRQITPVESNNNLKSNDTGVNGNGMTLESHTKNEDQSATTDKKKELYGSSRDEVSVKLSEEIEKGSDSMGWMIVIGDSFHNFADGLAIGAAFSDSWQTGLGTTIAIFFHELPHEFGDVAAQLSVGWSWKRVLVLQCVSQSTAFLGLFIGIPISENTSARDWILIMTAGMFLYIALSDIVPELLEYYKSDRTWKTFTAANAGILIGYTLMLIIAVLEGTIHI